MTSVVILPEVLNTRVDLIPTEDLEQYGKKGMKWGVRKDRDSSGSVKKTVDYRTEGFTIKKGTTLNRISTKSDETHSGSAYASFLKEDSDTYNQLGSVFSKVGATHYKMEFKATKNLTSPSKKERVATFKKLMQDPQFEKDYKAATKRMYLFKITQKDDRKMAKEFDNLSVKEAKAYRNLNLAIGMDPKSPVRKRYLAEFKKSHYDFILDEADSSNGLSKSPIIIIERSNGLSLVNVEKL